ncbi:FAS1-like dehydratase domain-containing protein, partial [Ellagibacter isourolithinifaciens]
MIEIPESVETWEETEKTIGETLPVIYGADAATLGWIRQWNEVIEADCPLYYDEELAQRLGYKTIPAPAGMAMAVGTASWWEPGVEEGRVGPLYPLAMPMLVPT